MKTKVYVLKKITEKLFRQRYLGKHVVLIKGILGHCEAINRWTPEYIANKNPELIIPAKRYNTNHKSGGEHQRKYGFNVEKLSIQNYVDYLSGKKTDQSETEILYFHNFPLFQLLPELSKELDMKIIQSFLPKWYRKDWMKFCLFFMGPNNSLTPLHVDCLLTHNLFFQIKGRKKFSIIHANALQVLPRHKWRYFSLNLDNKDVRAYLEQINYPVTDIIVEPGDMLYMPPGTLHQVRGLETTISFNIDFHTKQSVVHGVGAVFRGMPVHIAYYNVVIALGLLGHIPQRLLFPFYKLYLTKGCQ